MITLENDSYLLNLDISKYEFNISNSNCYTDNNWLIVKAEYVNKKTNKKYNLSDSSLLTEELVDIYNFLKDIKNIATDEIKLTFIEPEIEIFIKNGKIYIEFCYNLSPIDGQCIEFTYDINVECLNNYKKI